MLQCFFLIQKRSLKSGEKFQNVLEFEECRCQFRSKSLSIDDSHHFLITVEDKKHFLGEEYTIKLFWSTYLVTYTVSLEYAIFSQCTKMVQVTKSVSKLTFKISLQGWLQVFDDKPSQVLHLKRISYFPDWGANPRYFFHSFSLTLLLRHVFKNIANL